MKGKIIILSAPSGTGKSTIISRLMEKPDLKLGFSVSATSRLPRGEEKDGKDYFFLTPEEFMQKVEEGKFVEWEEVY
ncbi:MAG: guanylate kinase, partial [Muribaculaceae bacterium]|nr:guanylate kinase [Muribaculaceae bacterium]